MKENCLEHFSKEKIKEIITKQDETYCAIDRESGEVVGFYILHKNYPGRGSHIANALYAVRFEYRKKGIGKMLGAVRLKYLGNVAIEAFN